MKVSKYVVAVMAAALFSSNSFAEERTSQQIAADAWSFIVKKAREGGEWVHDQTNQIVPTQDAMNKSAPVVETSGEPVTICVGYGTEKAKWILEEALAFSKANPEVTIDLIGVGSFEGAHDISTQTNGEFGVVSTQSDDGKVINAGKVTGTIASCPMTVWSPASSLFRNYAASRYFNSGSVKGTLPPNSTVNDVFATEVPSLVQSPMVFVLWKNNTLAKLVADYNINAKTKIDMNRLNDPSTIKELSNAISIQYLMAEQAKGAQAGIHPLNITNPLSSNSGFSFTYMLSGELLTNPDNKSGLAIDQDMGVPAAATDVSNDALWLSLLNMTTRKFNGETRSLNNFLEDSTGHLMNSFLVAGPTRMGGIMTYENLALDMGSTPINQGDDYQIVYPKVNIFADHPYYVLNLPNRSTDQKKAAIKFERFLRTPEAQTAAVQLGFRPGVSGLAIALADSPAFQEGTKRGVTLDLTSVGQFVPTLVDPQTTANIEEGFKSNVLASICAVPANRSRPAVSSLCDALSQK